MTVEPRSLEARIWNLETGSVSSVSRVFCSFSIAVAVAAICIAKMATIRVAIGSAKDWLSPAPVTALGDALIRAPFRKEDSFNVRGEVTTEELRPGALVSR